MRMTISHYHSLSTLVKNSLGDYKAIVVEGIHYSGKSTLLRKLATEHSLMVYNSWDTYGGRKSLVKDSTGNAGYTYGNSHISSAFVYVVDALVQLDLPAPPLFDRGFVSTLYYAPEQWDDLMFARVSQAVPILWIVVRPLLDDAFKKMYRKAVEVDMRLPTFTEYVTRESQYAELCRNAFNTVGVHYIQYENKFSK